MIKFIFALLISFNSLALDDFDLAYYGKDATFEIGRTDFIVKMVFYENEKDLEAKFQELTNTKNAVRAFTEVHETMPTCYIHTIKPSFWDDREAMTILGHELVHCMLGTHEKIHIKKEQKETKEEMEFLKEECARNKSFKNIAGCKELLK